MRNVQLLAGGEVNKTTTTTTTFASRLPPIAQNDCAQDISSLLPQHAQQADTFVFVKT